MLSASSKGRASGLDAAENTLKGQLLQGRKRCLVVKRHFRTGIMMAKCKRWEEKCGVSSKCKMQVGLAFYGAKGADVRGSRRLDSGVQVGRRPDGHWSGVGRPPLLAAFIH